MNPPRVLSANRPDVPFESPGVPYRVSENSRQVSSENLPGASSRNLCYTPFRNPAEVFSRNLPKVNCGKPPGLMGFHLIFFLGIHESWESWISDLAPTPYRN